MARRLKNVVDSLNTYISQISDITLISDILSEFVGMDPATFGNRFFISDGSVLMVRFIIASIRCCFFVTHFFLYPFPRVLYLKQSIYFYFALSLGSTKILEHVVLGTEDTYVPYVIHAGMYFCYAEF